MILRDWRDIEPARLRACYDAEQRSWADDLGWDTAWTWTTVEEARVTWGLPGLVVEAPGGGIDGWTFWMPDHATLHVGGLVAASPQATDALLDALLEQRGGAAAVACFVRHRAPGLAEGLARRGFRLEQFHYFSRSAHTATPSVLASDPWTDGDFPAAVALIQSAYSGDTGRHFAPGGTTAEWTKYLSELVDHRGCGLFDAAATRVLRGASGLQGLALMTTLSDRTAHLAQLVVHPDARGRGLAGRLVSDVLSCAADAGKRDVTLLVGEDNAPARALYARRGFERRGLFIAGRCELAAAAPLPLLANLSSAQS